MFKICVYAPFTSQLTCSMQCLFRQNTGEIWMILELIFENVSTDVVLNFLLFSIIRFGFVVGIRKSALSPLPFYLHCFVDPSS